MARNPDLETTARDAHVPTAILTGAKIIYSRPPTPEEVAHAAAQGYCPVCDVSTKGCWCRWCGACSRFFMSIRSSLRTHDGDHYGIKAETCPTCVAAARTP